MKKLGALLLAAALVMSMTACGGGNKNTGEGTAAPAGESSTNAGTKAGTKAGESGGEKTLNVGTINVLGTFMPGSKMKYVTGAVTSFTTTCSIMTRTTIPSPIF